MVGVFSKEQRREFVQWIQNYFYENRGEAIGEIAAEEFLDAINDELGAKFFNAGVEAARKEVANANARLEEELFAIKRVNSK